MLSYLIYRTDKMGLSKTIKYGTAVLATWALLHNRCDAASLQKKLLEDKRLPATGLPMEKPDAPATKLDTPATKKKQDSLQLEIAHLTTVIEMDPRHALAYNNRGMAYCRLSRLPEAIADLTKAIGLDPNFEMAYANRGTIYCKLGKFTEAIADFTKAIGLDPNFKMAYASRGTAYYKLALADDKKADSLEKASLSKPSSGEAAAHLDSAKAHLRQDDFQAAFLELTKAIAANPYDMGAYRKRAFACASLSGKDALFLKAK